MSGYVRIPLVVVLSMMLAVLVPHFCSADTPPKEMMNEQDTMPVYHLGEIVVVRGKKNVPKSSLSEISTEVFRAHGTNTVKEVLTATPGVVVTSGSKGESRIQIRGFQSEETMILLDGRPINLPYYGETDLNMIPISNLSKIKVVKGPAAAVYGANTLGGLVNMISKRMKGVAVRDLRLSVGGNDTYDAEINFGARYGDLDYWVSLGYARSDGWNLSDDFVSTELEDGDLRDTSAHRTYNLDGKLNYTLRNGTVFSLSAGYYDAERGLPVATETPRPRFQRFPEWKRYYLDLSGEGFVSSRLHWRGKMYGDVAKNRLIRYSDASFSEDQVVFDSYHDSFDLGSRFVFTYQFHQDLSNTFGVSLRKDGIDRQNDAGESWVYSDALSGSVFSQFQCNPSDIWSVEVGASYNRMQADAVNASAGSLDPYVGVSVEPKDWLNVRTAVSRATRFPTLNHLYATVSGNPDLKPEQAVKLEIGCDVFLPHGFSLSGTYFVNDVDDLIDRVDRDSLYENIAEVLLTGVESGVGFTSDFGFSGSINHTYLDACEKDPEVRRYHLPRNKTDYTLSYRSDLGFEVNHTGQYVADRVDADQNPMRDYYLANLKVSYRIRPCLKLFVNIRNVLDKDYEEERNYPRPGRRFFVGIESRF